MNRFLVIGLGSMGKRRVRILRELYPTAQICGVDAKEERRIEAKEKYNIVGCESLEQSFQDFSSDAAFVCTPPLTHASIIHNCLLHGAHVFSELNLLPTNYEKNIALAKQKGKVLFLSSTHFYRKEIQYVQQKVKATQKALNYSFHVGQYLPDWHPWDVLQDFFVSQKETNGCRELFAIELPWILRTFGPVKKVQVLHYKESELPVSYDDSFFVLLEHETGHHGSIIVDVVSREPIRHLEVFGEDYFLTWNGTPDSLYERTPWQHQLEQVQVYQQEFIQHEEAYCSNILENAYVAEVQNFFRVIAGKEAPMYSFEEDKAVLEFINQIGA